MRTLGTGRAAAWALRLLSICALSAPAGSAFLSFSSSGGFCLDGANAAVRWPDGGRPEGLIVLGSYCDVGDLGVGRVESARFLAPASLSFYLAGYPGLPKTRLVLRDASGQEMELKPPVAPRETWRLSTFTLPPDWVGKPVQMVAEDRQTAPGGWLAFTVPVLPPTSLAADAIATDRPQGGFCRTGFPGSAAQGAGAPPLGLARWASFCQSGDAGTGWMASKSVPAGAYLRLYVIGYPVSADLRLAVENLRTGRQLSLLVPAPPGENWRQYYFPLPPEWKGQSIRVIAQDEASGRLGWLGFTDPLPEPGLRAALSEAGVLMALFVLLVSNLLLPPIALCAVAAVRGVKDPVSLNTIVLLAIGLLGWLGFWTYLANSRAGLAYSALALLGSCALLARLWRARRARLGPLRCLLAPWTLVACAAVFVLSLGLVRHSLAPPLNLAARRFAPPVLAGDNALPKVLAGCIVAGRIPSPMVGDWLSSDRPPLQAGVYLWDCLPAAGSDGQLPYLVISVVLQCAFLAGLWICLAAAGVGRGPAAVALGITFFSGFVLLNSLYTWPKLLPVAFLLVIAANVLTGRYDLVKGAAAQGAATGAAAALAMLCHGGSMFALLGIGLTMLILRRWPGRRFLLAAFCTAALLYVPWMLYQKYGDPPGDRLLKWHLAGVIAPHPDVPFSRLLLQRYRDLKLPGVVQYKFSNFRALAGAPADFCRDLAILVRHAAGGRAARAAAAASLRLSMFAKWAPCVGFVLLGPVCLLLCGAFRRRNPKELQPAAVLWLCCAVTLLLWSLIMFGPNGTYVPNGTYFTEIAAYAGSALAFWALNRSLAVAIAATSVLLHAALFICYAPPAAAGVGTDTGPLNYALVLLCMLSAAGILAILLRPAIGSSAKSR
jgi:hypothetical protein